MASRLAVTSRGGGMQKRDSCGGCSFRRPSPLRRLGVLFEVIPWLNDRLWILA
jgi:hypothetical protein